MGISHVSTISMPEVSENIGIRISVAYPKYTIKQYFTESIFTRKLFGIIANSLICYIDDTFTFKPRDKLNLHPGCSTTGH